MRATLVLGITLLTANLRADVLHLADGTTYSGILLHQTTTGTLFERRELIQIPRKQVGFVDETGTTGSNYVLVPQPQKIWYSRPDLPLAAVVFNTAYEQFDDATDPSMLHIRTYLEHAFLARGIDIRQPGATSNGATTVTLIPKHHVLMPKGPEAYAIDVSSREIQLSAPATQGLWLGAQTLLQLIIGNRSQGFLIRQCGIQDWPSTPRRICHLPRLTHKSDLELFRRYARLLARYKFNTLILENSGAIKLDKHPEAWWSDGFSKDEIRTLISDFKDLGFEVIPQLNSFGHVDEWLGAEPGEIDSYHLADLFSTAEYHDTLNPCNPRVYDILFDCYNEMLDVYGNPKYFHMGLDEARRRGFGNNADCKGEPPAHIFADHANRIGEFFANKNVTPVMWADLLLDPAKFPGIDNCNGGAPTNFSESLDLIKAPYALMDWHYDTPDPLPTLKYLSGKGHDVWATPWKDAHNTYGHAQAAKSLELKGICATTWNFFDRGADYMREVDILSAPILVAQYAWNPDAPAPGAPNSWNERDVFLRSWPSTAEKW